MDIFPISFEPVHEVRPPLQGDQDVIIQKGDCELAIDSHFSTFMISCVGMRMRSPNLGISDKYGLSSRRIYTF